MSREQWPEGLVTALVTPMRGDDLDLAATRQLIAQQVAAGVAGVAVAGGTGEHGALTLDERRRLAREVIGAASGQVAVIVQTGALTTRDAVALSEDAQEIGASGLLVPAPYGEEVNEREREAYYEAVNAAVSVPIMLYNTPSAGLMSVEQIQRLAQLSNVSAVKQSAADGTALGDLIAWSQASDFAVYTGWDDLTVPAILGGAHGALLGTGNVFPAELVEVIRLCKTGELSAELSGAWGRLRPLIRFFGGAENYVSLVKLAVRVRGLDVGDVRAPYLMPLRTDAEALTKQLRAFESTAEPAVAA
jgi:4-hydroxy-tetrahydrodipicolinate synthase